MAHESLENEKIALLLNDNFVNIKVDREERPDLDASLHGKTSIIALWLIGRYSGYY